MNNCNEDRKQRHDHEIQGSVKIAEKKEDPHNHRFTTESSQAIKCDNSHFHEVFFRTDFYENHFHEFCGCTGLAISVGDGKHVHFLKSVTLESDNHVHEFDFSTLIDNPIGD